MKNVSLIPRDWKKVSLEQIGKFASGGTPSKERDDYWGGDIPWLSAKDLKSFYLRSSILFITNKAVDDGAKLAAKGDILILVRGMTLLKDIPIGVATVPMAFNQDVRSYRTVDNCDSTFVALALAARKQQLMSLVNVAGHGTGRLATELLQEYVLCIPCNIAEQKKIAEIISTWDYAIELYKGLIAKVEKRKQSFIGRFVDLDSSCWIRIKLGNVFVNQKSKGEKGLPTFSVTMNDGLVPRTSLNRKNETTLTPEEHLLIEKDDIAYNMMRMWQGASGLAPESGLVSPAYVVLRSNGEVDPLFASYWFKMPRIVKKFQDYSHGLTKDRLRLYYKDFAKIALPLPPMPLQKQIASVMQCCDRELDVLKRKVDLLKQQKKGLMQQLLTGKIRVKVPKGEA